MAVGLTWLAKQLSALMTGTGCRAKSILLAGAPCCPGLQLFLLEHLKATGFSFDRAPDLINLGESPLPGYGHAPTAFRGMLFAPALSLAKTI